MLGVQGYENAHSLVLQVSVKDTEQKMEKKIELKREYFFNARELLSYPIHKALQNVVLNHSHLKGNVFSMFKVAILFLWGIPTKGLCLLKMICC